MGQRLVAFVANDPSLNLVAAVDAPSHPRLGEDAGLVAGIGAVGVKLGATIEVPVDAVIDFSVPKATEAVVHWCLEAHAPLVVATTGLDEAQLAKLRAAGERILSKGNSLSIMGVNWANV